MSQVADSESQENNSALHKLAMERLSLMIDEAPKTLSEVEEWLKNYYKLQSSAEEILSQDTRFKIVFVKKGVFNGKVIVASSKENDEVYWNGFWEDQKMIWKQQKTAELDAMARAWSASHLEQSKAAHDELYQMLVAGPILPSDLGNMRLRHGIPSPIKAWILTNDEFLLVVSPIDKKHEFYVLREKKDDRTYWEKAKHPKKFEGDFAKSPELKGTIEKMTLGKKSFFCGRLFLKSSMLGIRKFFSAKDVVSATKGPVGEIDLPTVKPRGNVIEGEFIVGIDTAKGPFLFFNQKPNSAVQVLHWSSFVESDGELSLEKYFADKTSGQLIAKFKNIIGNKDFPGHVIITDGKEIYLKGFSSVGNGIVEYTNVYRYDGDFSRVALVNQATQIDYKPTPFVILIPQQGNVNAQGGKHPVIDCEGWMPLSTKSNLNDGSMDKSHAGAQISSAPKANSQGSSSGGRLPPEGNDVRFNCSAEEAEFLKNFIEDCKKSGYEYDAQDIVRFHTCVKCGMFTLLGGAPGCGKSTLAALYARALSGNKRVDAKSGFLTVDVNPAWMEPSDILGHWNLEGRYVCADTGLVPFLRKLNGPLASKVGIVCLEEMNLARVEHYFSNFMQLISRPDEERILLGVPMDDSKNEENTSIKVPSNLRFIGTNNFDETTQRFSARFYDRCNYLEMKPNSNDVVFPTVAPSFDRGEFNYPVTYEQYSSWCNTSIGGDAIANSVVEKFKDVTKKLSGLRLTPSPRVRLEIAKYIVNRPFFEGCGTDKTTKEDCQLIALDEAIVQRVLPRYRFDYLRDETEGQKALLGALKDLPLSDTFFNRKTKIGERPSRT